MQPKTPGLLWDILDSARLIISWADARSFREYQQDDMLRSAVERRFEIIGEAARRLTRYDLATASRLTDLSQVIAFRNVLAHGYDDVDDARVWMIMKGIYPHWQTRSKRC